VSTSRDEVLQRLLLAGREHSTAVVMFHTAVAAKGGLSPTETKALDLLERFGPLTAGELAERSGLAPASVTGLIDRLEHKSVARRVPHPQDRRRVMVEMNPEYSQRSNPLFDDFVAEFLKLCAGYSTEQLATMAEFLSGAAAVQQAATARLTES
jgi:DNA-binding MarR family transcriptional regulator